jgi:2-oxoglutarate/2-oxoacid ferredoxin oxidoreductase subunit alpha
MRQKETKNPSAMAAHLKPADLPPLGKVEDIDAAVIRFAGDIGDGIEGIGSQFSAASTAHGNVVCTLPDPPAEIRAPTGALAGVSAFQVHFSKHAIHTPGDRLNALLAMNPAALKAHLCDLAPGGILIVNADAFTTTDLEQAGYQSNPLEDGSLAGKRVLAVPMNRLNREAVAKVKLSPREAERCKNFFALGLACWLFQRPLEPTLRWIGDTYAKNAAMIDANTRTLKAGYYYHETEHETPIYRVAKATVPAGRYRNLNGIDALALGILTAARQAKLPLVFAGFPVAPAADLLHRLCEWKQPGAKIIQAEDDLAAINLVIGAAFGGALGVTATNGQGLALQSESLGLAVMSELPCVVIDVQRAGPGAGMPTKVEQADLLQAIHGRNGECPLIVLALATPADGFAIMLEAARLAIRSMTPVIVLADAYLAQAAEMWRVPSLQELPALEVRHPEHSGAGFLPFARDEHLARPWATPGTSGLEHRLGGLEKENRTGNVSYDPTNHARMVRLRAEKIARVADSIPALSVEGPPQGDLLVMGWGSTYGAIQAAAERCRRNGLQVANTHLRYLHPLPANLGPLLGRYRTILLPELNAGQLAQMLRAAFPVEIVSLSKLQGQPFQVGEIESKIQELLSRNEPAA